MWLLYPNHPLASKQPDELFAEEFEAAATLGVRASLFSFEDFLAGHFRSRPAIPFGQTVVYRGWMLTLAQYAQLYAEIGQLGSSMLTSPAQYERCHHLPGWYWALRDYTPETLFFSESDDIAARLRMLDWSSCFLKDYVKSLSGEGGSMVRDLSSIPEVIARMKLFRGEIEGGVCARRIEEFDDTTEERHFVFHGTPFPRSRDVPDVVADAARLIDSPFFTVDTVRRRDGIVRIVELGDGQVSDRKQWTVDQFLSIFTRG